MSAPLVQTLGLTLGVGGRTLVRRLDWQASVGQRWCVIGRNAVGKSTLLRALAGLAPAPGLTLDGEVHWLGRPQSSWPAADAAAVRAFMPQHCSDRFAVTVARLLELSTVVPGARSASALLAALDAGALAGRSVMHLSGGERQRIALAQAAMQGAPLMLMDEPVAFQDPAHQMQVARWLTTLGDAALVISAHDVNWIARAATHVLALVGDGGWVQGRVEELLQAELLEQIYGCPWQSVGGWWVAG